MNYQSSIVIMSICISIFGSYTALKLSLRMHESESKMKYIWLIASACAMGFGIWSMHFTGMFALMSLHSYNWLLTFASLLIAIFGSAVAFFCSSYLPNKFQRILIGGTILGFSIAGMHYTGMLAIETHAIIDYKPFFVVLSILVGAVLSIFAMSIWERLRDEPYQTIFYTFFGSVLLGLAVSGMHYTAMMITMNVQNHVNEGPVGIQEYSVDEDVILRTIFTVTIILFGLALMLSNRSQQKYQHKLKLKEIKFQSLYENNLDPIVMFDAKGRFVKANQKALILSKNDLSKRLNSRIETFVKPEDRTMVEHYFSEALNGKANQFIFSYLEEDGQELILQVKNIPIVLEGKSEGFFAIIHDLTEQQRTEMKLKETTERLESFFNVTNDAINVTTADSRLIYMNPAFEKMFGWHEEELIGKELPVHLNSDENKRKRIHKALENKEHITNYETRFLRKDGTSIDVSLTLSPILDKNGELSEIAAITRDITVQKKTEAAIREKDEQYRLVTENMTDLVTLMNLSGVVIYASPSHQQILGYSLSELEGYMISELVHPEELVSLRETVQHLLQTNSKEEVLFRIKHKDGNYISFESHFSKILSDEGEVKHILISSRNVEQRLQAEQAQRESDEKYRLIAENTSDLIRLVNVDGTNSYASPSHLNVLGYSIDEVVGKRFDGIVHPDDKEYLNNIYQNHFPIGKKVKAEYRYRHKNGEWVWLEAQSTPVLDDAGNTSHFVVVSRVISERKQYEEQLKQMAYYDSLTMVPNRRLFYDQLAQTLKSTKRYETKFAVFYLDCDRFKWVNDTYGHETGDRLLIEVAARVERCIRDSDTLARLGGDEFAIILDGFHHTNEVAMVAERIIEELQTPWQINGHEFITTTSIGIAVFPYDGLTMDKLLANADKALYFSKEKGRNMFHFHSDIHE